MWNLLPVTLLASRILRCLPRFLESLRTPVLYTVTSALEKTVVENTVVLLGFDNFSSPAMCLPNYEYIQKVKKILPLSQEYRTV